MHKGVVETLAATITKNLEHKSAYVRHNSANFLYNIDIHFGADIVGEIDDDI